MRSFLLILCLFLAYLLPSQSKFQSISIYAERGNIAPTNDFFAGENNLGQPLKGYTSLSANVAWKLVDSNQWNGVYNKMVYGAGVYVAKFPDRREVGVPLALYGFFQTNLYALKPMDVRLDVELGMAFNWRHLGFNNIMNDAVSLPRTVFINIGSQIDFNLSKKMVFGFGPYVTHFSNGGIRRPNRGVNTLSLKASLKYLITPYNAKKIFLPPFVSKHELDVSFFAGYHNLTAQLEGIDSSEYFEGLNVFVLGLMPTYQKQISRKVRIGIGMDITYDQGLTATVDIEGGEPIRLGKNGISNVELGIFPSCEIKAGRASLILQPGYYLTRKYNLLGLPRMYERIGARIDFKHNMYAGVSLRAFQFKGANFIEWTLGKRFIRHNQKETI